MTYRIQDWLYGLPKVGADILSYCSRCDRELAHVLVSMLEGRPAKVLCKTCKAEHRYKRTGKGLGARPVREKKNQRILVSSEQYWEQKLTTNKNRATQPYSASGTYNPGDVIQHSSFGLGFVEELRGSKKMLVLFRSGEKVLVKGVDGS